MISKTKVGVIFLLGAQLVSCGTNNFKEQQSSALKLKISCPIGFGNKTYSEKREIIEKLLMQVKDIIGQDPHLKGLIPFGILYENYKLTAILDLYLQDPKSSKTLKTKINTQILNLDLSVLSLHKVYSSKLPKLPPLKQQIKEVNHLSIEIVDLILNQESHLIPDDNAREILVKFSKDLKEAEIYIQKDDEK
jgi:hypothetical protein